MNILFGGLLLVLAVMIVLPKGRILLKGWLGLIFENVSKTPDGVNAIYQQKIDEITDNYTVAYDNYKLLNGRLEQAKVEKSNCKKEMDETDYKIKSLLLQGREDDAMLFAEKGAKLTDKEKQLDNEIADLEVKVSEAKDLFENIKEKRNELIAEQEEAVRSLKTSKNMENIYNAMDDMNKKTSTDKLLDSARKNVKEAETRSKGAKAVHDNSTESKMAQIEKELGSSRGNDYLNRIKNDMNKYEG